MRELNWDALAIDPAVDAMVTMLRERWRIWMGVLDHQSELLPLSAINEPVSRLVCACQTSDDDRGTHDLPDCPRTLREWAEQSTDKTSYLRGRRAGLLAMLLPLTLSTGDVAGHLYVTGFVHEDTHQGVTRSRHVFDLGREPDYADPLFKALPRHNQASMERLTTQAEALAELIVHTSEKSQVTTRSHTGTSFCNMIGQSASMKRLFDLIERIATTNSTVLILGENGTGKELVARAVHKLSHRREQPYVVQNCAAIPSELIESELFGHKRGAFSGAHRDRKGLFESADYGTFFLDEIGEMDIMLQAKMLRVVQEGTFLPVGDSSYRKVDVRLIFATNRDLRAMVARRAFREDLYFRINVITLEVPPLRERRVDIPLLVEHFLLKSARRHGLGQKTLSPECMKLLVAHDWPGNVRELENELERMAILSGTRDVIDVEDLSSRISGVEVEPNLDMLFDMTLPEAVDVLERQMILASLERHNFNKTRAAKELGVSRRNLIRKVAQYGFEQGDSPT